MFLCFQAQKIGHQLENWWPKYRCKKLTYLIIEKSPSGFRSCLLCFKQAGWWPSGLLLFRIFYFSASLFLCFATRPSHCPTVGFFFRDGIVLRWSAFCPTQGKRGAYRSVQHSSIFNRQCFLNLKADQPLLRERISNHAVKCAKAPCLREVSHTLGSFRGKRMAPEPKLRCLYIFLFHFAPLILWPPAYEFCGFSQKRGHRSPCDFTVEKWPRPRWGKKSESTHYQIRQFAQNNTYLDVFQSLLSIQRSPVYYTLSFYYSTKCTTKYKKIFEAFKFSS